VRVGALVLLAPAGLRLPGHPVADLFLMSPEELLPDHQGLDLGRDVPVDQP
jgi:hypothetical protein